MRVLAIDHGSARAGCAISDPTGTLARPLGVIEPPDPRAVAELAAEHHAELVIVGLPISLSGAEGPQASQARAFRDALAAILDLPVETYDERLTTRLAERSARAGASAPADALAAAHLLESYLQAHAGASSEAAGRAAEPAAPIAPEPAGDGGEAEASGGVIPEEPPA
jgi:putative Holliday junction resolvase